MRDKTTNWAEYNAALKARRSLTIWLDKAMQWYAPASGNRARQRLFSEATIKLCLSIKRLLGLALRQTFGLVQSLLRMAGLGWKGSDFSTVSRRQRTLRVQLPYRASTSALDLLVDSTGIKFLVEGEWKRKKHGAEYRRRCLVGVVACNEALRACHRLGWRVWKKWSGYHRRSLLETKMHFFKSLGERVMARTLERQVVELHVRVALLNRFTQIGCPSTVPVPAMA